MLQFVAYLVFVNYDPKIIIYDIDQVELVMIVVLYKPLSLKT
jgi:hypothetical protein